MHDDAVGGSLLNLDVKASQSWEQRGYLSREGYAIHLDNIIIQIFIHFLSYMVEITRS